MVDAITSNSSNAAVNSNQFAELSSNEFMNIMITELQNQDPFKPQDSSALLEQLGSIRNIEAQMNLQSTMEAIVSQNQLASAGGLIGQQVTGLNTNNNDTTGLVTSVRIDSDGVYLELDNNSTVAMSQVYRINQVAKEAVVAEGQAAANTEARTTPPQVAALVGDLNSDGKVDELDMATISAQFGRTGNLSGDLNGDGKVDVADLSKLASQVGN